MLSIFWKQKWKLYRVRGQHVKPRLPKNLQRIGTGTVVKTLLGLNLTVLEWRWLALAEAVNGNGFVGFDENQYSIFISSALCQVTSTLDFEKWENNEFSFNENHIQNRALNNYFHVWAYDPKKQTCQLVIIKDM